MKEEYEKPKIEIIEFKIEENTCCITSGTVIYPPKPYGADLADY